MRIFFTLFLLIPSLSWGLTFKDGKQTDENNISKIIDSSNILFKINAGLSDNDTTINIPGKAEFPKHPFDTLKETMRRRQ